MTQPDEISAWREFGRGFDRLAQRQAAAAEKLRERAAEREALEAAELEREAARAERDFQQGWRPYVPGDG